MSSLSADLAFAYEHCQVSLRQHDPDRYFSCLFAPASIRPHLMALYAFSAEIAHIQEGVREPLTGEIRLQWWRDALSPESAEAAGGTSNMSPVAAAIGHTIGTFSLPRSAFLNLIDARTFDLYQEPMPTLNELEGYCGETCSVLFQLAAMMLAGEPVDVSEAAGHGGVAYAMTGILRAFPWHIRRRRLYVPLDILAQAGADIDRVVEGGEGVAVRQALSVMRDIAQGHLETAQRSIGKLSLPAAGAAFLPLTLVQHYLKLMDRKDYDPFSSVLDLPQWRRQWYLWRAARKLPRRRDV